MEFFSFKMPDLNSIIFLQSRMQELSYIVFPLFDRRGDLKRLEQIILRSLVKRKINWFSLRNIDRLDLSINIKNIFSLFIEILLFFHLFLKLFLLCLDFLGSLLLEEIENASCLSHTSSSKGSGQHLL